ncbi:S1 family peptidase [Mycobacterium rhizamassiliense]|uniref:S1 family peptidase n=1 Tax=Mycobacterium rhizamassiliense TaxID=1841860 RepID=UPI000D3E623D
MAGPWLRRLGLIGAVAMPVTVFVSIAPADAASPRPAPGMRVQDENMKCTASFAARGDDGDYYFITSGHCDPRDGSGWTYAQGVPLGTITASENEGGNIDAAIIRLDPSIGVPAGDIGGRPVHGVYASEDIKVGVPFCKLGSVTGETCGGVTKVRDDGVIEASVFSLNGDSGSPGYVKNLDGTVGAVGILTGSPDGDDNTSYFVPVSPLLAKWGLRLLP